MISKSIILESAKRIEPFVHRTPLLSSESLNNLLGLSLYLKAENLQKIGAFKARGASNAALQLDTDTLKSGLCTHSSGNHAQAIAFIAKKLNTAAYIVMPENANRVKVEAVKAYGGQVFFCPPTQKDRETHLSDIQKKTGSHFIHPFNDLHVISGQASAALEVFEELSDLDYFLAPVGGGGLLSGSAVAAQYFSPHTKVIGCEPELVNDAQLSLRSGVLHAATGNKSVADGLLTGLGSLPFEIIRQGVHDILCANEDEILKAMKLVWERCKLIIEPSSAVPLAVLIKHGEAFRGKKIGMVISGGNVDLEQLRWS